MTGIVSVTHSTVYAAEGIYAGWPANHGAWQRGDEFLVGFLRGPFTNKRGTHNIQPPFQKVQARSLDGGQTWSVEVPDVDFESHCHIGAAPAWNLRSSIIRCCGAYDHGGEDCDSRGGFYLSHDFGQHWHGAYPFEGLTVPDGHWATSRTAYLTDRNLLFLSFAVYGFDDYTICAEVTDNGRVVMRGLVCDDDKRAVMPAVTAVNGRLCAALRRRAISSCWIDLFVSDDDGRTWEFASEVGDTGGHNGNPPALIAHRGVLYCVYANRTDCTLKLCASYDSGRSWHVPIVLRHGACADIGYPRLFARKDGALVCVYYWSDMGEPQHIDATRIEGV